MYEYWGMVVKVHDGDTVKMDIDLGLSIWKRSESLRLLGINAPEVLGASREAGLAARDALHALVMGQRVRVRTVKDDKDKYGRYLASLFVVDAQGVEIDVNAWMLANGHAVPYAV